MDFVSGRALDLVLPTVDDVRKHEYNTNMLPPARLVNYAQGFYNSKHVSFFRYPFFDLLIHLSSCNIILVQKCMYVYKGTTGF